MKKGGRAYVVLFLLLAVYLCAGEWELRDLNSIDCCFEHDSSGCENSTITECTCLLKPECCRNESSWDNECVAIARVRCAAPCTLDELVESWYNVGFDQSLPDVKIAQHDAATEEVLHFEFQITAVSEIEKETGRFGNSYQIYNIPFSQEQTNTIDPEHNSLITTVKYVSDQLPNNSTIIIYLAHCEKECSDLEVAPGRTLERLEEQMFYYAVELVDWDLPEENNVLLNIRFFVESLIIAFRSAVSEDDPSAKEHLFFGNDFFVTKLNYFNYFQSVDKSTSNAETVEIEFPRLTYNAIGKPINGKESSSSIFVQVTIPGAAERNGDNIRHEGMFAYTFSPEIVPPISSSVIDGCLLYTSDAADE
eukprot:TRINITY_DN2871_c0_g1_i3.p1 TRINITY_DN2871_c0_g1~~TRINITY_DN2871_c0_g1_i3.p1  ORF type:complete len:377 (+),score=56.99 TRINITY_DN2871_c0_g1_i3:41-1132(+)